MKFLQNDDIRAWYARSGSLSQYTQSIGKKQPDGEYLELSLGMPQHVRFVVQCLAEDRDSPVAGDALDSIPFYSLCRGLFLPLSFLDPQRAEQFFSLVIDPPPDAVGREKLIRDFFEKQIGLDITEKLGCVLGDPFQGRKSTFRRDSMLRLLMSLQMISRKDLLDRLTHLGDVAVLFAESRTELRVDPPLTAAEVLRSLYYLPGQRTTQKFDLLRSLLTRCGKLEAYFLAKLILRKAGFGFDYQGPVLARILAEKFKAPEEHVAHAMVLTDTYHVAHVLAKEGVDGLRAIRLQPLVPVKPALAGGVTDDLKDFPVWVERKYDGIRFMLHKSTDQNGAILCGAYTRNRRDWLELVQGLDTSIKMLPANTVILDGELYGTVIDFDKVRPATVYEVYSALQGQPARPVNLKFAAFDLVYLNGQDLTSQPLSQRRQTLSMLTTPLAQMPLPIPISLSEGQLANNKEDLNRLYLHFRSQGYEGVITKNLAGSYCLGARDPNWMKRKPEITLDLVLLGAVFSVSTKQSSGMFGSYVIGARTAEGGFEAVGDVAGFDRARDAEIQAEIMREGLLTGRRIERQSSSGVRPGLELRPSIVVTVKFEGIIRNQVTQELSLRDPKAVMIRSDKSAIEADTVQAIEALELKQRVG